MKISYLEEMLKHARENFGDCDISFNMNVDGLTICECDASFRLDEEEGVLNYEA